MRRTLAADDVSPRMWNTPISAVVRTCVPPHSSREYEPSPIWTMRTTSPYFSPNSAIAPRLLASTRVVEIARTGSSRGDLRVDGVLDVAQLLRAERAGVREVEAQLVRTDV